MVKQVLIKHRIDNISVNKKLQLIFILCVLIPVVLTNSLFLIITGNNVKKQQIQQLDSSLVRTKQQFYKDINDASLAAYNIFTDKEINNALEIKYNSLQDFYDVYEGFLRDTLMKHVYIVNKIGNVNIYTDNLTIPDSSGYKIIDEEVKKTQWYNSAIKNPTKFYISNYKQDGKNTLSLVKVMNYYKVGVKITKILKIDFRDMEIIDTLKSEKDRGTIYLIDDNQQVLYSSSENYMDYTNGLNINESSIDTKDSYTFETKLDKYSEIKNWKLQLVVNKKDITSVIQDSSKVILYMGFINLVGASVIIYIISSSFRTRLKILSKHIKKVRKQNYEIVECYEGRDEIGEVITEFNRMTLRIQELIRDVYEVNIQKKNVELERKQAEINALQSQINPHFLFNVLESIRMRSLLKNELETAQIIKYVSKMFRRLLEWKKDMITLKEEMDYIEDFLKIQKYRFGDKINYEINLDAKVEEFIIPKMIFQPLVENACVHGIEGKKTGGKVTITASYRTDSLICIIKDNGTGIEKNKFDLLMENIDAEGGNNVGIKNVYNRLKLIYGEKFTFNVDSTLGKGTEFIITICGKCENSKE